MVRSDTTTKIDNFLQERSRLIFEFPGSVDSRVCPFFENPIISEKKTSNLVKYDVLGRTSSFLGYTGAKSRQFTVDFFITLPHVVYMATNELFTQPPSRPIKLEQRQDFFTTMKDAGETGSSTRTTQYETKRAAFLAKINGGTSFKDTFRASMDARAPATFSLDPSMPLPDPNAGVMLADLGAQSDYMERNITPEYDLARGMDGGLQAYSKSFIWGQAIDIITFWLDLIRASTLNSRTQPTLGPPIIRIDHGLLYKRIATVAENYSIRIDEMAGYEIVSLLPNRIKVTLSLIEIQRNVNPETLAAGSNHGVPIAEDMIKGWDDLLANMDPTKESYSSQVWTDDF